MGLIECIRLALASLRANKMRALLTMLGIIIGVSAVITITTLGSSLSKTLKSSFDSMGMNFIYVSLEPREYDPSGNSITQADYIKQEYLDELFEKYPDRFGDAGIEAFDSSETMNANDQTIKNAFLAIGNGYFEYSSINLLRGRPISQRDNAEHKMTCVVSDIFVRQYFKDGENPIGQTVEFKMSKGTSYEFTIVGVYKYSQRFGKFEPGTPEIEKQTPIYIPKETAKRLYGIADTGEFYLMITMMKKYDFDESAKIFEEFLDEKYEHNKNWYPEYEDPHEDFQMIDTALLIVTVVISLIAMISLLVGGVGVMNIMLVSVTERTKEIGIRKALGAKNSNIRMQFVVESIIICLIGGIIGILIGIGNGLAVSMIAEIYVKYFNPDIGDLINITVSPSVAAITVSVLFSMMIGVFFGYYPANKAAKMNPIDALRYD